MFQLLVVLVARESSIDEDRIEQERAIGITSQLLQFSSVEKRKVAMAQLSRDYLHGFDCTLTPMDS